MMHIGFLTPEFPHEKTTHAAGIGTSIKNLVTALAHKGVQISVFVYGQESDSVFEENGIKIHLIKKRRYSVLTWFFYRKYIQDYLNRFVISDNINAIEAPDWTGITAFMNLKAPLVIRFHGSDAYFCKLEKRKQKAKNFWFEKLGVRNATAFIAPTSFAGKETAAIFNIRNKEIRTIHYGLNLPQFQNDTPEVFERNLILYVGTIIRKKGVLELPEILKNVVKEVPEAKLLLIGGDSFDIKTQSSSTWELLKTSLDDSVANKVTYLGKVPYQEIQEYIKKAHVCVFPTFAETLGMVTIESMAMQKPVVNCNIGWANELIVSGESGYLVHPENHQEYANKIVNLLNDEDLCKSIGTLARKRVEDVFDIEDKVNENIMFYSEIIKK
ncbi:MAG: glycosyltransferase family 4 protein [Flavobacterium sp.]